MNPQLQCKVGDIGVEKWQFNGGFVGHLCRKDFIKSNASPTLRDIHRANPQARTPYPERWAKRFGNQPKMDDIYTPWNQYFRPWKLMVGRLSPFLLGRLIFREDKLLVGDLPAEINSTIFSPHFSSLNQVSGQIIIFHQPRFPWNKEISLTKLHFGMRSCEVAIIWPEVWSGGASHFLRSFPTVLANHNTFTTNHWLIHGAIYL